MTKEPDIIQRRTRWVCSNGGGIFYGKSWLVFKGTCHSNSCEVLNGLEKEVRYHVCSKCWGILVRRND